MVTGKDALSDVSAHSNSFCKGICNDILRASFTKRTCKDSDRVGESSQMQFLLLNISLYLALLFNCFYNPNVGCSFSMAGGTRNRRGKETTADELMEPPSSLVMGS